MAGKIKKDLTDVLEKYGCLSELELIALLRSQRKKVKEISDITGLSNSTVHLRIKQYGLVGKKGSARVGTLTDYRLGLVPKKKTNVSPKNETDLRPDSGPDITRVEGSDHYDILIAESPALLKASVNQKCAEGFRPSGSLLLLPGDGGKRFFVQPMMRWRFRPE